MSLLLAGRRVMRMWRVSMFQPEASSAIFSNCLKKGRQHRVCDDMLFYKCKSTLAGHQPVQSGFPSCMLLLAMLARHAGYT